MRRPATVKHRCALYTITNVITEIVYVGITINPRRRWGQHKEAKSPSPLHIAIRHYGKNNFLFNIEQWYDSVEQAGKEERLRIELLRQTQIEQYNVSLGGGKHSVDTRAKIGAANKISPKGKLPSPETRERMSREASAALMGHTVSEKTRQKISSALIGRRPSSETLDKMRAVAEKRRGVPISTETKTKISAANTGLKRSPASRQKMSDSHIGKPLSDTHREAKRKACQTKEHREKLSGVHKRSHQMKRMRRAILAWEMANDPIRIDLNE